MADIKFKLGFDLDKRGLDEAKKAIGSLTQEIDKAGAKNGMTEELKNAKGAAEVLDSALKKAYNNDFEKLNLKAFNRELKKSGYDLGTLNTALKRAGVDGSQAFREIEREMLKVGYSIKKSNKLLDEMFDTLGKTVKWNLASGAINKIQGSLQQAVGFTKSLDDSLNQIRIVSGKSADEMKVFSREANEAAKALGKTTTEYSDASLLFFQQGKNAAEVKELTEATLMGANITGTEVSAMADMITSALNGYSMAADKAIFVTDTLASVGAATGADFEELAVGMSKVASQAATVGVPFEKLNAMLATISETTREAPETIGTSLKTVFARMSEIKLTGSATDEDGVTMSLGKVQDALSLIDVSVTDSSGAMRDMGAVIEEIGGKWEGLDVATKSAITNAMAGQRQASRLMALFNQWERYEVALDSAMNATGATMEQNEVRMDSLSYKTQQMRAEIERTWMNLLNEEVLKDGTDMITSILEKLNSFIEMIGGAQGVLKALGGVALMVFSKQIAGGLDRTSDKIQGFFDNRSKTKTLNSLNKNTEKEIEQQEANGVSGKVAEADIESRKQELKISKQEYKYRGLLSEKEKEILNTKKAQLIETNKARLKAIETEQKAQSVADELKIKNKEDFDYQTRINATKEKAAREASQMVKRMQEINQENDDKLEAHEKMEIFLAKEAKALGFQQSTIEDMSLTLETLYGELGEDEFDLAEKLQEVLEEQTAELDDQLELKNQLNEIDESRILGEAEDLESNRLNAQSQGLDEEIGGIFKGKEFEAIAQGALKWGGVALSVAATAGPALKTMFDDTATESEKVEAGFEGATAAASILGTALGGPLGGVIGGLVVQLGKLVYENTGFQKILRENAKAVENFQNSSSKLKDEIEGLSSAQKKLTEIEEMASSGINNENREQYVALQNEIAEMAPQLVKYYDDEGNAVIDLTKNVKDLTEAKKEQLRIANEQMANKGDSFGIEYGKLALEGEDKIAALNEEIAEAQIAAEKAVSSKQIEQTQENLLSLQEELLETQEAMSGMEGNIQKNMIMPFLNGDKTISKLEGSLKDFSASVYDIDTVVKESKFGYEMFKSTKDISYMKKALDDAQKPAKEIGDAMFNIQEGAKRGNKESQKLKETLEGMVPASRQLLVNLSGALDLDSTAIQVFAKNLASITDESGMVSLNMGDIDKMVKAASSSMTDMYARQVKDLEQVKKNKEEEIELYDKASGSIKNSQKALEAYYDAEINGHREQMRNGDEWFGALNLRSREAEIRNLEAQKKSGSDAIANRGTATATAVQKDAIEKGEKIISDQMAQEKLNIENQIKETVEKQNEAKEKQLEYETLIRDSLNDYMYDLASTPEGYNAILEKYEELSGAQQEFFDALDSKADEDGFFFGMAEEIDNIKASLAEGVDPTGAIDEYVNGAASAFSRLPDEIKTQWEAMAEAGGSSMDKLFEEAKSGSKDAMDSISNIHKAQTKEMGKLYAVLNKDNKEYYQGFVKSNKKQLHEAKRVTGIMAEDYGTLAEYKVAMDEWQNENAEILANDEVKDKWFAVNEIISDKYDGDIERLRAEGEFTEAMKLETIAQSEMAQAAAYAQTIAKGEAEIKTIEIAQKSIEEQAKAWEAADLGNGEAIQAARRVANEELAKIQLKTVAIQAVVDNAKSELAKLGGEAGGTKENPTGGYDKLGGGGGGGGGLANKYDDINYGSGTKPPPRPTKPSKDKDKDLGGSKGGSDKGGSNKGDSEAEEVEDLEWEEDIYHDINIQLEQKQQLLDKLKKQQDKLYGKELLDNLAKQKKALQDQQKLLEKKLEMQKKDLEQQKQNLSKQGVQFSVDGTIANYNQLLAQKVAYVNSLSGEAKEAAKEEFDALVGMMEAYEDMLMNSITETENAIQDSIDAQREIWMQEFEYAIQLKIEISTDFKEALDYMKDMNDEFEDYSENYERTTAQIGEQLDLIGRLKDKLEEVNNNPDLTEKERLELLEKYNKELKDSVKDLKSLEESLTKLFQDTLKDGLGMVKDHIDDFKNLNDQLKHYEQTLKLIGEGDNYEVLDSIYEAQYNNLMGQIGVLNAQMSSLQTQKAALEAAGMKGTDEWKAIDDAIKTTQKDLNSLAQESLKLLQQEFKNSVDEIMSSLEDQMTGGAGFAELKKQHQELKEERKKYLDGEQKLLSISKLQQKVQKEIDETSDPAKKAELQKFMDTELSKLKEKDKLTKYDVDRANLIYDITLKQMALDDQRATKNIMRLVRDTQGNWVYEFTEDAKAIEKAQEEVSSSMEKLMELDKKRLEETQDLMMKLQEEYYKEVEQIAKDAANGKYKTEEELREALQKVNDKYNEKMVEANAEYEEVKLNATVSSMAVILDTYRKTGIGLEGMTEDQQTLLKALAEATDGSFLDMSQTIEALLTGKGVDGNPSVQSILEQLSKETGLTAGQMGGALNGVATNMQSTWGTAVTDMISKFIGEDGKGGFKEAATGTVDAIVGKWTEYQAKLKTVQKETGTDLGSIKSGIESVDKATEDLNKETDALIKKFQEEMTAVTNLTTAYEKNRGEIRKTIKDMLDYIDTINKAIDAIKRKNDTEDKNNGGNSGGSGGGSAPPPKPTPPPAPAPPPKPTPPPAPSKGSKIRVKPGRRWYHDSNGKNPSGPTDPYSNRDMYVVNTSKNKYQYAVGTKTSISSAMGWLKKEDLQGFDTGGYTGSWGKEGKVAMLHEKEIVLNKQDTSNILKAVTMLRDSSLANIARKFTSPSSNYSTNSYDNSSTSQNVTIHADFSGVKNSNEIEKAFENITNMASQYSHRR